MHDILQSIYFTLFSGAAVAAAAAETPFPGCFRCMRQLLGISRGADENEIKKAYRKAALLYHPDRQSSKTDAEKEKAGKVFRDIGEAYEVGPA